MREILRQATGEIHARLDRTVGHLPLSSDREYATFLSAQYCARSVVQRALVNQPPADLPAPPSQLDALTMDLADLGEACVAPHASFTLTSPHHALGAAWVLAGSSLGNRAMLARRRKAGCTGPTRFLADNGLATYFAQLVGVLGQPHSAAEAAQAIAGAKATFEVFEQAFAARRLEVAA